jgi:hypothetical protein
MSAAGTTTPEKTGAPLPSSWLAPEDAGDERAQEPVATSSFGAFGAVALVGIAVTQVAWLGALAYLAHGLLF